MKFSGNDEDTVYTITELNIESVDKVMVGIADRKKVQIIQ